MISIILVSFFTICSGHRQPDSKRNAVVTLVTGVNSGYSAGAVALGQSIISVGSKLARVAMVTPEVDEGARRQMSLVWEVVEVEPVRCNHKLHPSITPDKYDLQGANYQAGLKRWSITCTKFAAWNLSRFERVIFMDSDTLVVGPIDDALYEFSNASFLAAPEAFPPDNFNSGFMVLNPSKEAYENLLEINERVGSAEGGDQGVFNNGLCPNWFFAAPDDKNCGRLPWIFNVEAANFGEYNTLRQMSGLRVPSVIHFVSDGKPWKVLALDYMGQIHPETKKQLHKQAYAHLLWRKFYFHASKENPPATSVFDELTKPMEQHQHRLGQENQKQQEKIQSVNDDRKVDRKRKAGKKGKKGPKKGKGNAKAKKISTPEKKKSAKRTSRSRHEL